MQSALLTFIWILRIKFRPPGKASAFTHRAFAPAPTPGFVFLNVDSEYVAQVLGLAKPREPSFHPRMVAFLDEGTNL